MSKYNLTKLKASALTYGISFKDVADILSKWGPAILSLIIDGLKNGLTLKFLTNILETLGPLFLENTVNFVKQNKLSRFGNSEDWGPDLVEGEEVVDDEALFDGGLLTELLVQLLPKIMEKIGPALLEYLLKWLTELLSKQNVKTELNKLILEAYHESNE